MKNDVRRIEILAVVFVALALLTRVSSLGMEMWVSSTFGASREMIALTAKGHAMLILWNFVRVLVNVGLGIWLFISASKDGRAKWIWCLFGLVGGLTAAVLYVLLDLADAIKKQTRTEANQPLVPTPGNVKPDDGIPRSGAAHL